MPYDNSGWTWQNIKHISCLTLNDKAMELTPFLKTNMHKTAWHRMKLRTT